MKRAIVLIGFVLIACSKSEDKPAGQSVAAPPLMLPPTTPTCVTRMFTTNGGLSNNASIDIWMRGFDATQGDTIAVTYKAWNATTWVLSRPGFYADVSYAVHGSTATLTSHVTTQEDFAISATIKDCS